MWHNIKKELSKRQNLLLAVGKAPGDEEQTANTSLTFLPMEE